MPAFDADRLIADCRASSAACYRASEALLVALDQPATRVEARIALQRLVEACRSDAELQQHLQVEHLPIHTAGEPETVLDLLRFPSTFAPEAWSFTFYEGLSRYPRAEFEGRCVVELGTGIGWIALALALRCAPARMVGLDINPRAVLCARLNLYLNALDAAGQPRLDVEGCSLLDRVEFAESDLLAWCAAQGLRPDRVIGCIPQVLSPEPGLFEALDDAQASDETLHALSNYCGQQGQVEDQFGLGLIARAAEESAALMRDSGKLIFNIGGRPGRRVLERLFQRRGFELRSVWEIKVEQAGDTEINALVEIERGGPHRFEFFLSPQADEAISAATAQRYQGAGGRIYHALTVFEARLPYPQVTRSLLGALAGPGFETARSGLDLSVVEPAIAEERLAFLADLAHWLAGSDCFPYQATVGDPDLRRALAGFLHSYHGLRLDPRQFLIAPSSAALLRNLLRCYRPGLCLIEHGLARALGDLPGAGERLESPRQIDLCLRLAERLRPDLLVTRLAESERRSPQGFARLIERTRELGCLLVLDLSEALDLSSQPPSEGVFQYLAENDLPAHVALLFGLEKNRVHPNLQVCALASRSPRLRQELIACAELSYSRTPLLHQRYYARLLLDLLHFQRPDRTAAADPGEAEDGPGLTLAPDAQAAFAHPALAEHRLTLDAQTLRLDYGENALPSPRALKSALLEGFVRQHMGEAEADPRAELLALLQQRFAVGESTRARLLYADGVAPLFHALCEQLAARGARLLLPQGAYGHFEAAARLAGLRVQILPTRREQAFRLQPATLAQAAAEGGEAWLLLNAPLVNPTGSLYPDTELAALHACARDAGLGCLIDSIFSGLGFVPDPPFPALGGWLADTQAPSLLLGGLSKEFAAGGLRFGYAYAEHPAAIELLERLRLDAPHATLRYAAKRLLGKQIAGDAELQTELESQRHCLAGRAERLTEVLIAGGWDVLPPQGGLFLVARPDALLGQRFDRNDDSPGEFRLDGFAELLWQACGVLVNGPDWTGLPGYCRFVLSVSEDEFEAALERLQRLHSGLQVA